MSLSWIWSLFGMDAEQAKPAAPEPERTMTDDAWRNIKGWDSSIRDALKSEVEGLSPDSQHVKTFNIILMGEIGSGKSSFVNSIDSIFNDAVIPATAAGRTGRSLTKEFIMYELKDGDIPIRIGDTMGVEKDTSEADIRNILSIVDGHVPEGHVFVLNKEFPAGSKGYIAEPTIADKGHCVAMVINANDFYNMADKMKTKLQSLAEGLWHRKVPFFVLLTHLDEYRPEVKEDITKTYHIINLKNLVDKTSSMVLGLPKNQIYPVINYHEAVELDNNMDILLLYSLRAMVRSAQTYIKKLEKGKAPIKLKKPLQNQEM